MKKLLPFVLVVILITVWFGQIPKLLLVVEEKGLPVVYFYGAKGLLQVTFHPETEIAVANNLGNWKAASLYGLARDEGMNEALVAKSISHNLQLPLKAASLLSLDGIRLKLVKLKYAKTTKVINLAAISGEAADNLYLEVKSASFFESNRYPASIVYKAYDPKVLEKTQRLIEAMGFNVFYIKKDNLDTDLVCRITGPKNLLTGWVKQTFPDCQRVFDKSDGLTFEFGEKYADSF